MKIAIQGTPGSYHEQATNLFFKNTEYQIVYLETFDLAFDQVINGEVDYGVVAIANNRYGFIAETYKRLLEANVFICGEIVLSIKHQLLVASLKTTLNNIKEIHSQAPAIGQCQQYLRSMENISIVEEYDTAYAAKLVSEDTSGTKAAIASERAGELYGLHTLKSNIQDDPNNLTRFLIISKESKYIKNSNKTSLLLETGNTPGALATVLDVFREYGVNIDLLHSTFIANTAFKTQFFIEIDEGQGVVLNNIKSQLSKQGCMLNILGSYTSHTT